jgi:hypothetical protein
VAVHPKDMRQVFHLTDLRNLPGIVQHGVLARAELRRRSLGYSDVADRQILDGRARLGLHEWVPFHFFPKNPYDYRVKHDHPDSTFVVIAVHRHTAATSGWSVLPRHPLAGSAVAKLLPWDAGLRAIDWRRMTPEGRDYADQECRLVCMAEALCRTRVPPEHIAAVYVRDARTHAAVLAVVQGRIGAHVNVAPWAV